MLILHHTNVPKNVVQRKAKIFTYALENTDADYNVSNLRVINGANWFDINHPKGTINRNWTTFMPIACAASHVSL